MMTGFKSKKLMSRNEQRRMFYIEPSPKSKYKFTRSKWYEADHRYEDYEDVMEWCTKNFGPRPRRPDAWTRWADIHIDRIRFRDEKDYVLFMLRWS